MQIKTSELEEYLALALRLSDFLMPGYNLREEAYTESWRSKFTPSQQCKGLVSAFGDLAELGFDLSSEHRKEIDEALRAEGFMTLTELLFRHGKRIRRLLKKKKLVHEDDAMVLKGMLDANLLTDEDAAIAEHLVVSFGS